MNEILQKCRELLPEMERLTKMNKNNKFSRHFKFNLSLISCLLLHAFAQNLACILRLRSNIHACQNITQIFGGGHHFEFFPNSNNSAAD